MNENCRELIELVKKYNPHADFDMIERAYNIAEKAPILLDGLSTEEILLSDPDFIFYTTMGDESAGVSYMDSLLKDPVWQSMKAVKTGQVYQLPKDLFQYKPNSRWDEAYAYLIQLLYGDVV